MGDLTQKTSNIYGFDVVNTAKPWGVEIKTDTQTIRITDGPFWIELGLPSGVYSKVYSTLDKLLSLSSAAIEFRFKFGNTDHPVKDYDVLKTELTLLKKPVSNVLTYTLNFSHAFEFLNQDDVSDWLYADDVIYFDYGAVAVWLPPAVAQKRGLEQCGKVFQIDPYDAEDADGKHVRCVWNAISDKNIMTLTIDKEWLDSAKFPVVIS